ncbi:MAG TPA: ketopantoate reductase family protein [Candidatus Eisenbacteria bacterium]|nr:ketopantoate reductase family protein [Candidatus Eisenbacteria bacterium]
MEPSTAKARIAILGAGALGTLLADCFSRAGFEVRVLVRSADRAAALRRDAPGAAPVDDPTALLPADFLFVCVKSYQTSDAANTLAPAIAGAGVAPIVVSLQNGWGHLERLERGLAGTSLIAGTTSLGAYWGDDGSFHESTSGVTTLAPWTPGAEAQTAAAANLFTAARLRVETAGRAGEILWRKLVLNVAVNPLTAIHGVRNGAVGESPDLYAVALAAAREAVAVGAARGHLAAPYDPDPLLRALLHDTSGNRSSMAEDLARGRKSEADAILGAVLREGAAAGVPTPVIATLAERMAALEPSRGPR